MGTVLAEAAKLQQARMQVIQEQGGDGSQVVPQMRAATPEQDGMFDMARLMGALGKEIVQHGEDLDIFKMTGTEELEFASELFSKDQRAQQRHAALMPQLGPRGMAIPFPMIGLQAGPGNSSRRPTARTWPRGASRRTAGTPWWSSSGR